MEKQIKKIGLLDFILPAINATVFSNYLEDLTFVDSDMYLNELRRLRASHNQNVMYVILTDDYKFSTFKTKEKRLS